MLTSLAAVLLGLNGAQAANLPTGAQVVGGQAAISTSGTTMLVQQATDRLAVDWQSFNVGQGHTVKFEQPSATSAALNRVLGSDVSLIQGSIQANGRLFLVNPNGVAFTPTAQVDVGSLVASTLNISADDFMAGKFQFEGDSTFSVENHGLINATNGGTVALIAAKIVNMGPINAPAGSVFMASGRKVLLDLGGPATIEVQEGALDALIEQGGSIRAAGGQVLLTARAARDLVSSVINHSGLTDVSSIDALGGKVVLEADQINLSETSSIQAKGAAGGGQVLVGGDWQGSGNMRQATTVTMEAGASIDASATINGDGGKVVLWSDVSNADSRTQVHGSIQAQGGANGGSGGRIETSGHQLLLQGVSGSTNALKGQVGEWLLDPVDFTIASSGGDITGSDLSTLLNSNSVTIHAASGSDSSTDKYGVSGTNGDILVNDRVNWSTNNTLTLSADRNININRSITASGATGKLSLVYGQGAVASGNTSNYYVNAAINLQAGSNFSTTLGSDGVTKQFQVITDLGTAGSTTGTDLQGMNANLSGNYALGSNINASATTGWNAGVGFSPVGTFAGSLDGLGHVISNLTINSPNTYIGLFGVTASTATVRNLGIVDVSVTTTNSTNGIIGPLAGMNYGYIYNCYATGNVTASRQNAGGLVGVNQAAASTIDNSYSSVVVQSSSFNVGGLVGQSTGLIRNSYATGNVTGDYRVGGLVGWNASGSGIINNSYAAGLPSGNSLVGGFIGLDAGGIFSNNYWNSSVYATGVGSGTPSGVTGLSSTQMKTASNFSGFNFTTTPGTTGNNWVMVNTAGGLNSGTGATLPMLASEYSTTINNAHQLQLMNMDLAATYTLGQNISASATGTVHDVWINRTLIPIGSNNAPFTGTFDGQGYTISGLAINNLSSLNSLWGWSVGLFGNTGTSATVQNVGLVGGSVVADGNVGGLVGQNGGTIRNSYNTGTVSGSNNVGGLVGLNGGTISSTYASGAITLTGGVDAGGLVGSNYQHGSISDSYATGSVTGATYVGGLVGRQENSSYATISNSYATGVVAGTGYVGGLLGENTNNTVTDSFFSAENNPSLQGIANGTSTTGAIGKTNAELKTRTTYLAGWNFTAANNEVWNIDSSVNGGYPFLCGINGSCTVQSLSTPIYLRLITGSSYYGDSPILSYSLYDASTGGNQISDAAPTGSVTWSGTVPTATSNVGAYALTYGSGITLGNSGYSLNAGGSVSWTVSARPITVTAGSLSRAYGAANPTASTFTVLDHDGDATLPNSDTITSVNNAIAGSATVAANAGTSHVITPSAAVFGTGTSSNYAITYSTGALTITKANATVTANSDSKTYNGQSQSVSGFTASGLVNNETTTVLTGVSTSGGSGTNAGSYTLTASGTDGNYNLTFVDGALTITKRGLTLTADDKSKTMGEADPSLTYQLANLIEGDALTGHLTRAPGEQVGKYVIDTTALNNSNYDITYVDGEFSIAPLPFVPPKTEAKPDLPASALGATKPVVVAMVPTADLSGGLMLLPVALEQVAPNTKQEVTNVKQGDVGKLVSAAHELGYMGMLVVDGGVALPAQVNKKDGK